MSHPSKFQPNPINGSRDMPARASACARPQNSILRYRPFCENMLNFGKITPVTGQLSINLITNDIISLYNVVITLWGQ